MGSDLREQNPNLGNWMTENWQRVDGNGGVDGEERDI